jgi:glutamine amidotransferase
MCELFAMSARQPATVNFSLEEFARHGGLSAPHKDGWGIAYVQGRDAWVIKEAGPASSSDLIPYIEEHRLRSTVVLSSIRLATCGVVSFENTQPYSRELAGRAHVFAHNGDLPGIFEHPELRTGRFRPMGTTDSEYAFCALLSQLEALWLRSDAVPKFEDRLGAVSSFAEAIRSLGPANFLYWDGDILFVHGHRRRQPGADDFQPPGVHLLSRTCPFEPSQFETTGVNVAPGTGEQNVLLVASVPLSQEPWQALGNGDLVAVSAGKVLAHVVS